jgi:hypothetical protein
MAAEFAQDIDHSTWIGLEQGTRCVKVRSGIERRLERHGG